MASTKTSTKSNTSAKQISTPSGQKSTKEVKEKLLELDKRNALFAQTKKALQLLDLTKTESRTFNVYSKDLLRTYLKNPLTYQSQIRNLSQFLYRYCFPYRRLCWYNASMIDLSVHSIIPMIDYTQNIDQKKLLETYYKTINEHHRINLESEIFKCALCAWRQDTCYGYIYDDGTEGGYFIYLLDPDCCKVSSIEDGIPRYAFDFSYFKSHSYLLEYWDSEWETKYRAYEKDSSLRWQELDYEREFCIKVNIDDITMDYPPFASLFESIIDLIDLQGIQSIKDELSIYKLLVVRLKTLSGAKQPDDFEVDIDSAIEYYDKLLDELPEEVAAILSPMPIDTIEFKGTDTSETDAISNAISNLFKKTGSSQILDNEKSGSTIFKAQILADTQMALASLLPQIQKYINIYLDYRIGEGHAFVKYHSVSPYTKDNFRSEVLKSSQYGTPTKLLLSATHGLDPLESLCLSTLENDILKLHDNWIPLQSSHTQTSDGSTEEGAPEKDVSDLTDEGEASREEEKNYM